MKKRKYVTRKRDRYTSIVAVERSAARMRLRVGKARLAAFAVGAASFAGGVCAAEPATADYATAVANEGVPATVEYIAPESASAPVIQQQAQPVAAGQLVSLSTLRLLAAAPVTDYIAVSTNVTAGATTRTSNDLNAMAIGPTSAATGVNAIAVGSGTFAARSYSTAVGTGAAALGMRVTAVGMGATSGYDADNGVSIGYMASVDGADSLAIGTYSEAAGNKSVAIGMYAVTDPNAPNSLALGAGSLVSASGGVAIGASSVANRSNAVSVGNTTLRRQIINLAAGTLDTDAVNVAQLRGVAAGFGSGAAVNADGSVTLPTYAIGGNSYRNVGDALTNLDGRVTSNSGDIGSLTNVVNNITNTTAELRYLRVNSLLADASAAASEAIAIGGNAQAGAANAVALGANAVADRANTVSVGAAGNERQLVNVAAGAFDTDAVNIAQLKGIAAGLGGGASVNADGTITLPAYAIDGNIYHTVGDALSNLDGRVTTNTTDIDSLTNVVNDITNTTAELRFVRVNSQLADASASGSEAIAIGGNAQASAASAVALGANAVADRANTVSIGTAGNERQLVNVAAGSFDTDAVNIAQLKGIAAGLGGGASVNADGTITQPSYAIDGNTYRTVGDALTNLDGRVTTNTLDIDNLTNVVNNIANTTADLRYFRANSLLADASATGSEAIAIGGNARASALNSVALGAGAVADRANSVSVGAAGYERQITNVAAGTADTDAVNVRQLKDAGLIDGNGNLSSAVTYDNANGQTDYSSITLGKGAAAGGTQIHNVASGVLDSDAVNLGQLNDALSDAINHTLPRASNPFVALNGSGDSEAARATGTHAAALGANAAANGDEALAVGANAVANGNTATALGSNALANGERAVALGWGSNASAEGAVALGAGSLADRANTVSVGSAGNERQITNVAPGTRGTDAVNLDQLNAAFNQSSQALHDLDRNTRKGIASASALQIVTPYLPGRTTLNAGIAAYRGQAALGIGVSRWNDKGTLNFNAGVASSGGNSTIVRAGVGIVIGD
ncbi:hypothetical protein GCM10027093_21740 [Paraburkholderia jirisanensis]